MSQFDSILNGIAEAAKVLDRMGVPVVGMAPIAIEGARKLAGAFDAFKEANGGSAPPQAQAVRDARLAEVLAHAESTASKLEG